LIEGPSPFSARLARATRVSGWIGLFLICDRAIGEPLHARGYVQGFLAACNALAYLLSFPGSTVAGVIYRRSIEHVSELQWVLSLLANFVLYSAGLCVIAGFRTRHREATQQGDGAGCTKGTTRRQFFRSGVDLAAGGVLGGGFGYSLLFEPSELRITHRQFAIRDLPKSLTGLRLAQVSDLHHGPWFSMDRVRDVVRQTNTLKADMILLTGDYVYESPRYIAPAIEALAGLKANIGIVGILGNHDWWERGVPMKAAFARHGLRLIDNTRVILTPDRKIVSTAVEGLCIAGVGDLWEDVPDYHTALRDLPDTMPRLLLAHNPDAAEDPKFLSIQHRVDLMISGHTHGGQVWIPGLGTPILPSRFGQKYASGLVAGPKCPVFISRGIGLSGLPIRFGVPPEIVVLELVPA
jgi:predicted MPP superfamily phosphohydrolase